MLTLQLLIALRSMFFYCTGTGDRVVMYCIYMYNGGLYMAQACARLCHQRRRLLNDVGGNGESGENNSRQQASRKLPRSYYWLYRIVFVFRCF